jgi:hypothetical protein
MSLLDLFSDNASRQSAGPGQVFGVVTGFVADIKDPLNLGRVKLLFPWLAEDRFTIG